MNRLFRLFATAILLTLSLSAFSSEMESLAEARFNSLKANLWFSGLESDAKSPESLIKSNDTENKNKDAKEIPEELVVAIKKIKSCK